MTWRSDTERSGHGGQRIAVHSGMAKPKHRNRPTLTVTIDAELDARLRALVERLPGATLSVLLDELLEAVLPLYEDMADGMIRAKRPDGSMDEVKAQDHIAAAIGSRILRAAGLPLPEVQDTWKGGDTTP